MSHPMAQQTAGAGAAAAHTRFADPFLPARQGLPGLSLGYWAAVFRWNWASTLMPGMLNEAGLIRIGQARHVPSEDLIELLDAGGYARYDFRTTSRLLALSEIIDERYGGRARG